MANEAELLDAPETAQVDTPEVEAPESLRETLTKAFDEDTQSTPEGQTPPAGVEPPEAKSPPVQAKDGAKAGVPPDAKLDPNARPDGKATPTGPLKAPAQWKPEVREHWNKLPRPVQEEILRREGDSMRLIGSVGHKIRMADEVVGHIQPFMETLQANGSNPSAFMGDIFTTVRTLAEGDARAKAETIANIVQSYGVDIRTLDAVLTHRVKAGPEATEARRLAARANAVLQDRQRETQQRGSAEAERALSAFAADPKHEFLDDVRDLMADLMQAGRAETLEDAYAAAIWAHPDTRKILLERQQQQRAQAKGQRAMAARRASSAVHGTPTNGMAGAQLNPNASLRETLEAAFDEHTS